MGLLPLSWVGEQEYDCPSQKRRMGNLTLHIGNSGVLKKGGTRFYDTQEGLYRAEQDYRTGSKSGLANVLDL